MKLLKSTKCKNVEVAPLRRAARPGHCRIQARVVRCCKIHCCK